MTSWIELSEFDGVDLSESYILDWAVVGDELRFELDIVLVPSHPQYSLPPPEEWACYRRGTLLFPEVIEVRGLPSIKDVHPAINADGTLDYGQIDWLESLDSGYQIEWDYGEVFILSGPPQIILEGLVLTYDNVKY